MENTPIAIRKTERKAKNKMYNYYEARTTLTLDDGTKIRLSATGKTRKEATENLRFKMEMAEEQNMESKATPKATPKAEPEERKETRVLISTSAAVPLKDTATTVPVHSDTLG